MRTAAAVGLAASAVSFFGHRAFAEEQPMNTLAEATSGPLRCTIRRFDHGDAIQLRGVLAGSDAVTGHFRFAVVRSGPSGTSNINQANPFKLVPNGEMQVAQVTINRDTGSHVSITFSAVLEGGAECRAEATL
jgi:hypothetical protein